MPIRLPASCGLSSWRCCRRAYGVWSISALCAGGDRSLCHHRSGAGVPACPTDGEIDHTGRQCRTYRSADSLQHAPWSGAVHTDHRFRLRHRRGEVEFRWSRGELDQPGSCRKGLRLLLLDRSHDHLEGSAILECRRYDLGSHCALYREDSLLDAEGIISGPAGLLGDLGYQSTAFARQAASWFSDTLNIGVSPIHIDLFIGTVPGSLGEVSALLLILGGIYLAAKHIITWHTPISYILSFSLLIWIFGGVQYGTGLFSGDVLFHLFSGGMMLGALFMATDMVTSPTTYAGMIIFGIFTGFLTFLFRIYGSLPEGVSLAIIIMNIFVPMIDRYIQPRRFGVVKQRSQA